MNHAALKTAIDADPSLAAVTVPMWEKYGRPFDFADVARAK